MERTLEGVRRPLVSSKSSKSRQRSPDVSSEEIRQAMKEFLAKGGKIKQIETEWIEEGPLFLRS